MQWDLNQEYQTPKLMYATKNKDFQVILHRDFERSCDRIFSICLPLGFKRHTELKYITQGASKIVNVRYLQRKNLRIELNVSSMVKVIWMVNILQLNQIQILTVYANPDMKVKEHRKAIKSHPRHVLILISGENIEPFCARPKHPYCDPLFASPIDIKNNCAPVYYSSQSPQTSCAVFYRCRKHYEI